MVTEGHWWSTELSAKGLEVSNLMAWMEGRRRPTQLHSGCPPEELESCVHGASAAMTGSTSPFSQVGTAELGSYPRGWIGFALRIALKVRLSIPLQSALAPRGPVACKLAAAVLKPSGARGSTLRRIGPKS